MMPVVAFTSVFAGAPEGPCNSSGFESNLSVGIRDMCIIVSLASVIIYYMDIQWALNSLWIFKKNNHSGLIQSFTFCIIFHNQDGFIVVLLKF